MYFVHPDFCRDFLLPKSSHFDIIKRGIRERNVFLAIAPTRRNLSQRADGLVQNYIRFLISFCFASFASLKNCENHKNFTS